jgi:CRISPR-associated protein Csb1
VRTSGRRTGSRIDPLGVLRRVEVFKGQDGWDVVKERAGKGAKAVRPSEINHGNIAPTVQPLGVTCDHVEHIAVLSFAGLRRLGFGGGERDRAGRTLLAALGITALAEQDTRGYALRSRCDLVREGSAPFDLVHADGSVDHLEIDTGAARALYTASLEAARKIGFSFAAEPIRLKPQEKLVEIVRRSQTLALEGAGGEADEGGA